MFGMSRGTSTCAPTRATRPKAETARKVACQPKCWPMKVPSGIPVTKATVMPLNIVAMALAAFSRGTRLVATTEPTLKNTPCAKPVSRRATISVV
ncbi:hypothetical protein D3C77_622280 [compost metagenome]